MRRRLLLLLDLLGDLLFLVGQDSRLLAFLRSVFFLTHGRSPFNHWGIIETNQKSNGCMLASAHIVSALFCIMQIGWGLHK